MKRVISILLVLLMIVMTGCSSQSGTTAVKKNDESSEEKHEVPSIEEQLGAGESNVNFTKLSDPQLHRYIEDVVYSDLVYRLADKGYYVENVETKYISEEYLEELDYNSKENVYFGYTLSELIDQFGDEKYVFTLSDDGATAVEAFRDYDDTYERVIRNVAIGSGVILICVTVTVATGGVAPAVSMVFAASAKTATICALSSGTISAVASGVITGIQTKDFDAALKAAALNGSESFKWGAITGAVTGGAAEAYGLYGATANGLTMNEAAMIQRESKYPLDVIKEFRTMDQYKICKEAGLRVQMVNGKTALVRDIDWNYVDEVGRTNYQRVMEYGLSPIDPASGKVYELHHIGQKVDSTLAILTKAEHMQGGNNLIWHDPSIPSAVHDAVNEAAWVEQRKAFWIELAKLAGGIQ